MHIPLNLPQGIYDTDKVYNAQADNIIVSTKLPITIHVKEYQSIPELKYHVAHLPPEQRRQSYYNPELPILFIWETKNKALLSEPPKKIIKQIDYIYKHYSYLYKKKKNKNKPEGIAPRFKPFYILKNSQIPNQEQILNMTHPRCLVTYNLEEILLSDYDQFWQQAQIQWIDQPNNNKDIQKAKHNIYNYLALTEQSLEQTLTDQEIQDAFHQ